MRNILIAMALMAFSTPTFAEDKPMDVKVEEKKDEKKNSDVSSFLIVVSTNHKTGEVTTSVLKEGEENKTHKKDQDDHAATLLNWGAVAGGLKKAGSAVAKGASYVAANQEKIMGGVKTAAGLAAAGVGIAQAAGAKVDTNNPAYIAFQIANGALGN